ncbi:MAG: TIGR02281 family clan AA aspartic protease [Desulfobacterales bacterium]
MICPDCHAPLRVTDRYCAHCGRDLYHRRSRRIPLTAILAGLLLVAGAVFFLVRGLLPPGPRVIAFPVDSPALQAASENRPPAPPAGQGRFWAAGIRLKPPVGTVTIKDIAGHSVARIQTAIFGRGWLALPAESCLGGFSWQFQSQGGEVQEIVGGIIGENDAVGIWQLQPNADVSGPRLAPWEESKPLLWASLASAKKMSVVVPQDRLDQRYTTRVTLSDIPIEPGIFIQEDRAVGWTFADMGATGYLWRGLEGDDLVYELGVSDYYRSTFENSREEQFILALAQADATASDQLRLLAGAFLSNPAATGAKTFDHLQPAAIVTRMEILIDRLRQNGRTAEAADAFDDRILVAIGDVDFAIEVAGITQKAHGAGVAVELIENVQADPAAFGGIPVPELDDARRRLYRQWMDESIRSGDLNAAQTAYERGRAAFEGNPRIHLMGVELALALSDWPTAERLLYMQAYPAELNQQVKLLEDQIAVFKSEAGKIVIRFAPGSEQIPVAAVLSSGVEQNFVVDTGASMVTIPQSTARKLGLTGKAGAVRRQVHTAGGTLEAEAVVLPSLEVDGRRLYNIEALVLDLPNQPEVGLLGLNYLRRFRMDLNSERGVLTLAPR